MARRTRRKFCSVLPHHGRTPTAPTPPPCAPAFALRRVSQQRTQASCRRPGGMALGRAQQRRLERRDPRSHRPRLPRTHRSGESRHKRTKIPARKRAREIPTATPTTTAAQRRREPEPLRVRPWLVTERGVQDLHRMPTTKRPGGACLSPRSFPRHALRRARSATSSRCPHLPWWQVPSAGRFPLTDPLMKKRSAEDPRSRRLPRTTQQKMDSEIGELPLGSIATTEATFELS